MPAKKNEEDEVIPANYDAPVTATTEENPKGDGLKYVGPASTRVITKQQWNSAGVKGQETVTWNRDNNFTVKKSSLSKDALEKLSRDPGFISVALDS